MGLSQERELSSLFFFYLLNNNVVIIAEFFNNNVECWSICWIFRFDGLTLGGTEWFFIWFVVVVFFYWLSSTFISWFIFRPSGVIIYLKNLCFRSCYFCYWWINHLFLLKIRKMVGIFFKLTRFLPRCLQPFHFTENYNQH